MSSMPVLPRMPKCTSHMWHIMICGWKSKQIGWKCQKTQKNWLRSHQKGTSGLFFAKFFVDNVESDIDKSQQFFWILRKKNLAILRIPPYLYEFPLYLGSDLRVHQDHRQHEGVFPQVYWCNFWGGPLPRTTLLVHQGSAWVPEGLQWLVPDWEYQASPTQCHFCGK